MTGLSCHSSGDWQGKNGKLVCSGCKGTKKTGGWVLETGYWEKLWTLDTRLYKYDTYSLGPLRFASSRLQRYPGRCIIDSNSFMTRLDSTFLN